jgi:asparagine synthase (glutamine-hydrolysing)
MCGICGIVNLDDQKVVDRTLLQRMCDSIRHRGPDGEGIYLRGPVGLGHRRLSIIDLATGDQPMTNEDGTIWIILNGEIYNYRDLTDELRQRGHIFSTRSDTEAIIHAYEEWGAECCAHLRGMFAYALWDENNRRLVLARDRLGKKPLIYTLTPQALLFASELRTLLCDSEVSRQIDIDSLYAYMMRLYIPTPRTVFQNIFKLPPAHYLVYEDGKMEIKRYWQVDFSRKPFSGQSNKNSTNREAEICDRLWDLLREVTRMRLISEVPLGAFLSGGVDSSAIVGIMSTLTDEPVKTFSIRFEEMGYDETPYARKIANLFGTDHHELTVKPSALEVLPTLVWHYSEPFADSSAIPTYYVSKLTRQFVTVALSGDAGDENFAGYDYYRVARWLETYKYLPLAMRRNLPMLLHLVKQVPGLGNLAHRAQVILRRGELEPAQAYTYRTSVFTSAMSAELWQPDLLSRINQEVVIEHLNECLEQFRGNDPLDRWQYMDLLNYLPDDILVKVDIASMANALEVRAPLLDHEIVEFAASLPSQVKLKEYFYLGLTTKYIFKKTLERLLPKDILYRRKHGFGVPISEWFRGELRSLTRDILLSKRAIERGYFQPKRVEQLINEHEMGQVDHGARLWALLNLELWHRTFIDELRESPLSL